MKLTEKQLFQIYNHNACDGVLEIKPNMFYFRKTLASGIVCNKCNGLWINAEDDIFDIKDNVI